MSLFRCGDLDLRHGDDGPDLIQREADAFKGDRHVGTVGDVEKFDAHAATVKVPVHRKVKPMLIGELAQRSGIPPKTLRYYEDIGLFDPPERSASGYRHYGPDLLDRLAFIRSSQALGLTLGEIRSIIALRDGGQTPCGHVLKLLVQRSEEIDQKIRELRALKVDLAQIVERASSLDPADCNPSRVCHLIGTT